MAECKISDQQYSGLFGCEGFAECCGDVAVDPVDAARGAERDVWLSAVGIGVHIADGHGGRDMEGCGAFGAFDNGACDAAFEAWVRITKVCDVGVDGAIAATITIRSEEGRVGREYDEIGEHYILDTQ